MELTRAMLLAWKLPIFLWEEVVAHAAYLRNRAVTRALDGKSPDEIWNKAKPDVSHLWEFASDVWVLDETNTDKLCPWAQKFIFTGFKDGPQVRVKLKFPKIICSKQNQIIQFSSNWGTRGSQGE